MTDEELSELAECLEDACREHLRKGGRIDCLRDGFSDCRCPMGVLFGSEIQTHPSGLTVSLAYGLPLGVAMSFTHAFDGQEMSDDNPELIDERAYNLGRLFREQYP